MGDASDPDAHRDELIGRLALELHLVSAIQLRDAMKEQGAEAVSGRGATRSLSSILVARGLLTENQVHQLTDRITRSLPTYPPFGKYNILREIGRDASGVVYDAEDREVHRRVALKMLVAPESGAGADEARFLRESRAHQDLPLHPGIVPVLEAGVIEGARKRI